MVLEPEIAKRTFTPMARPAHSWIWLAWKRANPLLSTVTV
jgi:hypothetical protein